MKSAIQRNAHPILLGALTAFLMSGCASVNRVQYPASANPTEEVSKLEREMDQANTAQRDVLAPKEMERSQKHLNKAKKEMAKGDMDDFWDELGTAKGYLDRATFLGNQRQGKVQPVLRARQVAIDAGARSHDDTRKELHELDESFKKNARALDKAKLDTEVWDRALVNYGALHLNTVREGYLGEARDLVASAKKRGARVYAPRTLKETEGALKRAERAIGDQPDNPSAFLPLTNRANEMARTLMAVNATSRQASGKTNEEVARDLVRRNREVQGVRSELMGADAELRALTSEAEWNQALEDARAEFSEDEAEVYRQGDRLLIRLKKMHFPVGSAEVPEQSKELLTKVSSVIEDLNAKNIEVQGHTDSTGSRQINKKISEKRAAAVADYLEDEVEAVEVKSVGFGFEKPIAANRSKEGRAENRRVDVVIIPTKAEESNQQESKD